MTTLASPAIILTAAVTVLTALVMVYTFVLVGRMRGKHGINAPAMSGHPDVERALRVQGNTVEQVVIFLPLLWVAALYFPGWWAPAFGAVWCVGRVVYAVGYMKAPASRSTGFFISSIATIALLVLSVIGLVQAWMASAAV